MLLLFIIVLLLSLNLPPVVLKKFYTDSLFLGFIRFKQMNVNISLYLISDNLKNNIIYQMLRFFNVPVYAGLVEEQCLL